MKQSESISDETLWEYEKIRELLRKTGAIEDGIVLTDIASIYLFLGYLDVIGYYAIMDYRINYAVCGGEQLCYATNWSIFKI